MMFTDFLATFVPKVKRKEKQVRLAEWMLETTGSKDAAVLKAELELELLLLFNDKAMYEQLLVWDKDPHITDPLLKRQLNVLIRRCKPNLVPKELLEKITQEESELSLLFTNFRPEVQGRRFTDNEIRDVLKNETDVQKRKETWEASKEIGKIWAPHILKLVELRNEAARSLGYDNFFSMQLELQEVDEKVLFETLDNLAEKSAAAYDKLIQEINTSASARFGVSENDLGPWTWADPFCQEDPMDAQQLDQVAKDIDIIDAVKGYYDRRKFHVDNVLKNSDNFERPGKNQHAFCTHIDREGDVRTLNNIKPTIKWLETLLHELGHAVYDLGIGTQLPWLLREPPHTITTEAMALLMGRQAYRAKSLEELAPRSGRELREKAEVSLRRRQLIFSRWVLVMTYFERELYRNPQQNLQELWWKLVARFQKIHCKGSRHQCDWAAKYHMGLGPVYYFSYLLGELFASMLEEKMNSFPPAQVAEFFTRKVFLPGNSIDWNHLIAHATGAPLSAEPWLTQFAN